MLSVINDRKFTIGVKEREHQTPFGIITFATIRSYIVLLRLLFFT